MNSEQEIRAKLGDFAADQDLMRDVYMTNSQRAAYQRILSRALEQPEGREAVAEPANGREVVAEMVRRFLSWRVPPDFAPDGGISFTPHPYPECWPIGTNLLTEQQAKAMFLQCLPAIAFECMEWKDRALSAEKTIERMADEFNRENGLTFMGEPLILTTPPAKVPEGWRLVPVEATDEMIEAAWDSDAADYVGEHKRIYSLTLAWAAMLAAAPQPATKESRDE